MVCTLTGPWSERQMPASGAGLEDCNRSVSFSLPLCAAVARNRKCCLAIRYPTAIFLYSTSNIYMQLQQQERACLAKKQVPFAAGVNPVKTQ
jgi:hypothetical protein